MIGTAWCAICKDCSGCCATGCPGTPMPPGRNVGNCKGGCAGNERCSSCEWCFDCLYFRPSWNADHLAWGNVIDNTSGLCGGCASMQNLRP
jgi:hypothetical protein